MISVIVRSLRDFIRPQMLVLSLLPCVIGFVLWIFVFLRYGEDLRAYLLTLLPHFSLHYLAQILGVGVQLFAYTVFGGAFMLIILFMNLLLSSFYAPLVVGFVRRDYPQVAKDGFGNVFTNLWKFVKIALLFGVLFIMCIPLYFVPFLGQIAFLVLSYYFFQITLFYDIASSMMDKAHFQALRDSRRIRNHLITLFAYLFSLIPFFNFFALPLQMLILTRYFFMRLG